MKFSFVSLLPTSLVALALLTGQAQAQVVTFDTVSDFTDVRGSVGNAEVTDTASGQLSLFDNGGDTAEAYADFSGGVGVLDGFQLDFDVEFNNGQFTSVVSDPEVLIRFSNPGVTPNSGGNTGFQLNFRHETDDSSNQIRATNAGDSSTASGGLSAFANVPDGQVFGITALVNNALVDQNYVAFGGGSGTVAANTYDLFIDGNFINNYTLAAAGDNAGFDPTLGFGTFGLRSSSNSDLGTEVLFDNITIGFGDDNGFIAAVVPEPSSAILLLGGLFSLGLIRRRNS